MSFTTPVDGQPAIAEHIAQLTETLSGTRAIPVTMQTLTVTSAANLPNQSVSNVELASDTARANLLTNGGFEIWQRGNGPFTTNGAWTADRWSTYLSGGTTISVTRDTTNSDGGGTAAAVVVGGSVSSGNIVLLSQQPIHASDMGLQVRSRTFTFSARVATSVAGGVRLWAQPFGGGSDVRSANYSGGGAWQTLSVTFTVAAGATAQMVVLNFEFILAGAFYLDNAMLVVGSVAADYAPLHPADDLARCQRYYEFLSNDNTGIIVSGGQCYSTTSAAFGWLFKQQKAVVPSITTSAVSSLAVYSAAGGTTQVTSIAGATAQKTQGASLNVNTAGGLVAGNATVFIAALGQTGVFAAEANP